MNFDEVLAFCQKVYDCKGTTLFTGVGKSAYIAKKVCTRATWGAGGGAWGVGIVG